MTSEFDVERVPRQRFLFDCSCGAPIETDGETGTCCACGERIEVRRVIPSPKGNKFELRIRKHRRRLSTEALLGPRTFGTSTGAPQPGHHRNRRGYEERFARLGLQILLAPLYIPLLLLFVSMVFAPPIEHEDRMIVEPEPTDCVLFSGCHYVKHTRYDKGYTVVTWERVTD